MFNNLKVRATHLMVLALIALTLALASYHTIAQVSHTQADAHILVADGECPGGSTGTCGSGGGG